jgi:hypothetical protein
MKNKTYMASTMHRRDEKDVRNSGKELKGKCQLKDLAVVWRVILTVRVKTVTFSLLITRQAMKFMGRSGHGSMEPVVSHTNLAV